MSDDLIVWLRTQLDEDERVATEAVLFMEDAEDVEQRWDVPPIKDYLKAWLPARALRDVEAKRRIIDRYEDARARIEDPDYSTPDAVVQAREYEDFVLPALALAYADRPGYVAEWAPA